MKLNFRGRRRIVREFENQLKEYPYNFSYGREETKFDNFNHHHICFARLCGASAFEQTCPFAREFSKDGKYVIGHEDCCDSCVYNARIDFNRLEVDSGIPEIKLYGKPEIRLNCSINLIDQTWRE